MNDRNTHTATRAGESGGDPLPREDLYQHRFRVTGTDTGPEGHAMPEAFLRWAADGRDAFLAKADGGGSSPAPAAEPTLEHERPLYAGDEVSLELWREADALAFRFVNPSGEVAATGRQRVRPGG